MFHSLIRTIDAIIAFLGRVAALSVLAIIAVMVTEMVSRGVFGHSLAWTGDVSSWLLVALIFLGGPWAMQRGNFVRVDALYDRFGPRTRALVDTTLSTVLFVLFCGALIKFGLPFAMKSFAMSERSATGAWDGPVWIAKSLMPLGACLLALAWISHLYHAWRREEPPSSHQEGL